jgi:iron-sulfur cluster insertion protein
MPNITITPRAQQALQNFIAKHAQHVRLSINAGGCSGFDIVFAAGMAQPEDLRFGLTESALLIDPVSCDLIDGATVDFLDEIGREGFVVNNIPNMEARCGCGKSFSVV